MKIAFLDLGTSECGESFSLDRLQIKFGTEWSDTPAYSWELTIGCNQGDFRLYPNKADLINHMIGERESFQELFPEYYEDYLNIIEHIKMFKH